jgi:hypothetical protein
MRVLNNAKKSKSLFLVLFTALALITTSCGDGSDGRNISIPGVDGPKVTLLEDKVLIAMVFENIQLEGGLRYNIPKYPNSYVEISPDLQTNGTLMGFSIDLDDVFGGTVGSLDPQTLPGGRALPGVSSGRLPAVAFSIEKFHGISIYLGPKVFGVFVPVGLGLQGSMVTARFYTSGTRTGNISLVGEDANGENSGLLLMLDMGSSVKRRLEKVAQRN